MSKTYIIILHIGNLQVTKNCITSLERNETAYNKIILVNNDTHTLSKNDFPYKNLEIIENKKNLGYAAGVNKGIAVAIKEDADYIVLLNNDTLIRKPFLASLITIFQKYPTIGIAGPALNFIKDNKNIFDIGGRVNMWTGRTTHEEVSDLKNYTIQFVNYISGAAMVIKREVIEKVGMFDENFFLYYEDVDFCLRAKEKEFEIAVDPEVTVHHLLSKTIGKVSPFAVYYQTRSALVFGEKYMHSPLKLVIHRLFLCAQACVIAGKHPHVALAILRALYGSDLIQ